MKKILVIEDNHDVRENLCEILELDGYTVISAENGKIGVEQAREHRPDLILCDVMMPVLDGFGVLKILNKTPELNQIPFIYLTAKAENSDFRKGMGLGAEDYITKPFDDLELLSTIEMRLKKAERLNSIIDNSPSGIQNFFSEVKGLQEFENVSENKEIRTYRQKDLVFEEGQNPVRLYYVVEGQVRIYQINEHGKELTTELIGENEFFGHLDLVNDKPYKSFAACLVDSKIKLIPKSDFMTLLFNNRDFAAIFIKLVANKTERTEIKLIEFAYSSVRKKVANALIEYCQSLKITESSSITFSLLRDELASLAGTTKETAIRTLADFKSEKLISINGKDITILDYDGLLDIIQ